MRISYVAVVVHGDGHPRRLMIILSSARLAFGKLETSLKELPTKTLPFFVNAGIEASDARPTLSYLRKEDIDRHHLFPSDETIFGEQGNDPNGNEITLLRLS